MSRFSPQAARALDAVRGGGGPKAADRARVRAELAARLGAPTLLAAPPAASAPFSMTAKKGRGWARVLVRIVFAIGAGALVYAVSARPEPASVGSGEPHESVLAREAIFSDMTPIWIGSWEKPVIPPDSTPEPKRLAQAVAVSETQGIAAPSGGSVEDELAILLRAHDALKSGDPEAALKALNEHARRFPAGVLSEERSSQRVVALCAANRIAEARAEGERFLRAHPTSPGAARVRASCAFDHEPVGISSAHVSTK